MDRRYPYTRRRTKRARLQQRVAAALMLAIAGGALGFALTGEPDHIAAGAEAGPTLLALASTPGAAAPAKTAPRRIYPYSIVPGGAATQSELARVIRTDKVVAAHYASFEVDKARVVAVTKPRAVHVSYRKGDQVYWTSKKVMLAEGETLLSDGSNEMRTRCANRISDVAQFPVEAQEPSADVLDSMVEEDGDGAARAADEPLLAVADSAGMLRHTGRGMQAPLASGNGARALASSAGKLPSSSNNTGMNSMTLAQFGSSGSLAALLGSGTVAPVSAGSAPPTLEVSADAPVAPLPEAPGGLPQQEATLPPASDTGSIPTPAVGGGTGSTLPDTVGPFLPGAQAPATSGVDARPPASGGIPGGSSGGGGSIAVPAPGEAGAKPGPFIPEPSLALPPPAVPTDEEDPDSAEVPEPPGFWLFGAALAGMALLRRRPRAA